MNGHLSRPKFDALIPVAIVIAILYVARDVLIPLALAILISFLLAPFVRRLERWRLSRIMAVMTATFVAFAGLAGLCWIVGDQLIDLANDLPKYKNNLQEKIMALRTPSDGPLSRATETLKELSKGLDDPAMRSTAPMVLEKPQGELPAGEGNAGPTSPSTPGSAGAAPSAGNPMPVAVVYTPKNAFENLKSFAGPIVGPLATASIVIVFAIFILLGQEDLRDRIIHLMGRGHLGVTTNALQEAGKRVSRYLVAQLIVNATNGIPLGIGLYFLGIPNAVLWGLLAVVLRFIPYVGVWISAGFPLALSLAVSPGWTTPLMTFGLFLLIELINNNFIEPWLYGASTGLSPMAVLVAAVFWTWLWGTVGLLLATPLTVCIAVLGKYIPHLQFLDVLLGDHPPIAPEDRLYQRLLAGDEDEACFILESYTASHNLEAAYDQLIIPALRLADEDFHAGAISAEKRAALVTVIRSIISDTPGELAKADAAEGKASAVSSAVCLPAGDEMDETAGLLLTQLLRGRGYAVELFSSKLLVSEVIERVAASTASHVCISVVPPNSSRQALYLARKIRERAPNVRITFGIWGDEEGDEMRLQRFRKAQLGGVVTTLALAATEIQGTIQHTTLPKPAAS